MNRDFIIPKLTPAQARMILIAQRVGNAFVSPQIAELATQGRLTVEDIGTTLELDSIGLDICQFIADYNHRCAIPYEFGQQQVIRAIAAMIPRDRPVLFLTDDPILWVRTVGEKITPFAEKNEDRCQHFSVRDLRNRVTPSDLVRQRGAYLVANITPEHLGYEWLGKLFPQIIIYCQQGDQYNLPLGGLGQHTAARHAAAILYPQVVSVTSSDNNLKLRGNAALPLMGCFNGLLAEKAKKKPGFRLKKYSDLDEPLDDLF
jgi:hypothetical protein